MTAVQGTSAAVETKFLSKPIVAGPGTACTETYLVAGHFGSEGEAANCARVPAHSVRPLSCLIAKSHPARNARRLLFCPRPSVEPRMDRRELYKRYGLTDTEIAFIESQVAEHDSELFDEVTGDEVEDE